MIYLRAVVANEGSGDRRSNKDDQVAGTSQLGILGDCDEEVCETSLNSRGNRFKL
jgi:hypothetical protein